MAQMTFPANIATAFNGQKMHITDQKIMREVAINFPSQFFRGKSFFLQKTKPKIIWYYYILYIYIQSKSFNSVGRNISALVGCIKKLRALYEVQLLEIYKIPQLNLI